MTHEVPRPEPMGPALGADEYQAALPVPQTGKVSAGFHEGDDAVLFPQVMLSPTHDALVADTARSITTTLRRASVAYWLTGGPVGDLVRRISHRGDSGPEQGGPAPALYTWLEITDAHKAGAVDQAALCRMREFLDRKVQ